MGRKANQIGHFTAKSDINTIISTAWQVKIAGKSCLRKKLKFFSGLKKTFYFENLGDLYRLFTHLFTIKISFKLRHSMIKDIHLKHRHSKSKYTLFGALK